MTRVQSQTRMPVRTLRGSDLVSRATVSPSSVPSRNGQAVCQMPASPSDSSWLARPIAANTTTTSTSATTVIGQA